MSEVEVVINEKLPMQLDSVSWNKSANLVAVGAYMIDPSNRDRRVGTVFLVRLLFQDGEICGHEILQEIITSGVLDLRWEPTKEQKLVVAASESLIVFHLDKNEDNVPALKIGEELDIPAMSLYTQWISETSLVYSDAGGVVNEVHISPIKTVRKCQFHDNLTWVVQYSSKHNLLFAGSDEGKFTGCVLDNLEDEEKHFKKKFEVGVTSIIFFGEDVLAVGSYDDTLRLFTISSKEPISLSLKKKIGFGGALWRTISFPKLQEEENVASPTNFYIVAACARNGIHFGCLDISTWKFETNLTCMEYEGFLAYGLDASLEQDRDQNKLTVVSCYFDNNQFHVWKTKFTAE